MKNLERRSLSCIIEVGPKYNPMGPYKREAEGILTQKRRKECDHGNRD